jgi:hypothetical protein
MPSKQPQWFPLRRGRIARATNAVAQTAGSLVGAGAAIASGSPVAGALVASTVEEAFGVVGEALLARSLSPDEERRIAQVLKVAHDYVFNRRAAGDPTAPWVITGLDEARATPVEVMEAGLLRARDQFEEKKLHHLGHLLGWLMFQPNLSAADAQHFQALAARLRYRQLVLASVLYDEETRTQLPDTQFGDAVGWTDMGLIMEVAELVNEGILLHEGGLHGPGSFSNINLRRVEVLMQGSVLYDGMNLKNVDAAEKAKVFDHLKHIHVIRIPGRNPQM